LNLNNSFTSILSLLRDISYWQFNAFALHFIGFVFQALNKSPVLPSFSLRQLARLFFLGYP